MRLSVSFVDDRFLKEKKGGSLREAKQHPWIIGLSFLGTLVLFPLEMQEIWGVFIPQVHLKWVCIVGSYLVFALLLMGLVLWLHAILNRSLPASASWKLSARNAFFIAFIGCILYLGVYACLFGYSATFDFSVNQCRQMTTGQYSLIHPVIHTLLCQGLLFLWNDPAIVAVFHVLCFSCACATYVLFCRWSRLPQWWAVGSTIILLACMAQFVLCLNKDVPFISGVMLLTTGLSFVVLSDGKRGYWATGAGLVLAATMRFDGLLVALAAGTGLLFFSFKYRIARRSVSMTCAISCALSLFCVVAIPRIVHANKLWTGTKYAKPAFVLACLRAENPHLRDDLKKGIDEYCAVGREL